MTPASDRRHGPTALRAALAVVTCGAIALAWALAPRVAVPVEPALAVLLRGMAALKGLLTLIAAGLVSWRFGLPISARAAGAYLAAIGAMAAACVFIGGLVLIAPAAAVFHVAAIGAMLVAWREDRRGLALPRWARAARATAPVRGAVPAANPRSIETPIEA